MTDLTPEQEQENKDYALMYNTWRLKLIKYVQRFVNEEDAKDIAQSLFINLYKTGRWKDIADSPGQYLMTAVRNNCFNFLGLANQKLNEILAEIDDYPEQDVNDLDDKLTKEAQMEAIKKAMPALPKQCRKTIELLYFEEKSHKEAAEMMGVTVDSISKQQNIGLKKIRKVLGITEKMKKK